MFRLILALPLIALLAASCSSKAASAAATAADEQPEWLLTDSALLPSADTLYSLVEQQVAFGPRVPGTKAHTDCREHIIDLLHRYGADSVTVHTAPVTDPSTGKDATVYNIFASINPAALHRVILLAHYDSRPTADEDPDPKRRALPIDGANDGASGVAVMLETARLLAKAPLDSLGVDLLFTDYEDSGIEGGGDGTWCLGAQAWAEQMPYTAVNRPQFGILLDMVGGKNAVFPREYFSDRHASTVVDKVWAVASAASMASRFPNSAGGAITDDHLPLNQAGIPTIDIIESNNPATGSFNPTWHTSSDNLASIDPATMQAVATVVVATLRRENSLLK